MTTDVRPAYREPMVWLMLAIPAATIVGGLVTLSLAMHEGAADVAPQPVTRTAQAQVSDIAPEMAAAERHLRGTLSVAAGSGRIAVALPGVEPDEGPLQLDLVHPMYAREDRHFTLARSDGKWRSDGPWPAGRWHLSLVDRDGLWRIAGGTHAGPIHDGLQADLQSAMATP